jgi:putative transposase
MDYRRAKTPGATYFFTVVTYNRHPIFRSDETIALFRQASHSVKAEALFAIDPIAVLPNHIYTF